MLLTLSALKAYRYILWAACVLKFYPYNYDSRRNRLVKATAPGMMVYTFHKYALLLTGFLTIIRLGWSLQNWDPPLALSMLTFTYVAAYSTAAIHYLQLDANMQEIKLCVNILLQEMEKPHMRNTTEGKPLL